MCILPEVYPDGYEGIMTAKDTFSIWVNDLCTIPSNVSLFKGNEKYILQ